MTIMTCVCGYSVDDGQRLETLNEYYKSGSKAGQLKSSRQEWVSIEPNKERFIKIEIERDFGFVVKKSSYYSDYENSVSLYACPSCHTVKVLL